MRNREVSPSIAFMPAPLVTRHAGERHAARLVPPVLVFALGIALAACLATPADAQSREAAFAVRVTDEDGAPISGAQILAQTTEPGSAGGAPPILTDELGQAVVAGLTEGEWFVEVSHPSYMLFAAYLDLRAGKKPQVGFSSQVNTETSWKPMTVKFFKASPEARRGTTTRRPAERAPPEVVREAPSAPVEQPEPPRVVRPERSAQAPEDNSDEKEMGEQETAEPAVEVPAAQEPAPEEPAAEQRAGEEPATQETVAETISSPPITAEEESATEETMAEETSPEEVAAAEGVAEETVSPESVAKETVPQPTASEDPAPSEPREGQQGETAEPQPVPSPTPDEVEPVAAVEPAPSAEAPTASAPEPEPEPTVPPTGTEIAPDPSESARRPDAPPAAPTAGDPMPGEPAEAEEDAVGAREVVEASPIEPESVESAPEAVAAPDETATPSEDTADVPEPDSVVEDVTAESPIAEDAAREGSASPGPKARSEPPAPEPRASGAAPRVPRFLRSAAAGSCPECDPGEWAVAAEQEAARAGESRADQQCSEEFVQGASRAARLLADGRAPRLEGYAGPLLTAMWRFDPSDRDPLEELLGPRTDPASHCQMAGAVLPAGAEFTGYVIEAWDVLGGRSCLVGFDCAVGQSRWLGEPEVAVGDERTVVFGIFKNRSTRRERRARLTIYFRPPSQDWTPASR